MADRVNIADLMFTALQEGVAQLDDRAICKLTTFLESQLAPSGGFRDRAGDADLYYTGFGLALATVLPVRLRDGMGAYLDSFGSGDDLDLVHLCSLIRSRVAYRFCCLPDFAARFAVDHLAGMQKLRATLLGGMSEGIEQVLSRQQSDGGFTQRQGDESSVYGAFLAQQTLAMVGRESLLAGPLLDSIGRCATDDGGYADTPGELRGTTPATAAALVLQYGLQGEVSSRAVNWLKERFSSTGGVFASPIAPVPDLLSTAVALFALRLLGESPGGTRGVLMDFIDMHWDECGGFLGHLSDSVCDCEYTFYGLLAIGSMAG